MKRETITKEKTMKTANTWCPEFPGFYNTIYEPQEDSEIEHINDIRTEKGLNPAEFDAFDFDYAEYFEAVSLNFVMAVESELIEAGYITAMKHEGLISPKEYNFSNDSINCAVEFTEDNIKAIEAAILKWKEAWKSHLSCSFL